MASEPYHQRAQKNQYFQGVSHISSFGVSQLRNGTKSALCLFFPPPLDYQKNKRKLEFHKVKVRKVTISSTLELIFFGWLCCKVQGRQQKRTRWYCKKHQSLCLNQLSHQDAPLYSSSFTVSLHTVFHCRFLLWWNVCQNTFSSLLAPQGHHHGYSMTSMTFRNSILLVFFYKDIGPVGERQKLLTSLSLCRASCLSG